MADESRVFCLGCRRWLDIDRIDLAALITRKIATKKPGTDTLRAGWGSEYVPASYDIPACASCEAKLRDAARREAHSFAYHMAAINRHRQQIESRGVSRDEAIAYAVAWQTIMSELELPNGLDFVAKITGNEELLEPKTPAQVKAEVADATGWTPPATPSDPWPDI